ncbi:MAG TPA: XdhC family protein [Hyphomicrobium sp.]|nr:XdhC family protein [Hyphomicrobium sp.]
MNIVRPDMPLPAGLLGHDDVLPALFAWQAEGLRTVLVTLASIEGGSPRPVGAQMAVCEDGRYAGYLSGGCLEQAVVLEAQAVLAAGENRLVRYGRGSPYFDVRLPCGSGLDVYFDAGLPSATLATMKALRRDRKAFALITDLETGTSCVSGAAAGQTSRREGNRVTRVYLPEPRIVMLGAGPTVSALCQMAQAAGIATDVWAGDDATRAVLEGCRIAHLSTPAPPEDMFARVDAYCAVVIAFHDHVSEPGILKRVLERPCFYIGVLGNHAVHRQRLAQLAAMGFSADTLARMRAPIGAIPQAKGQATLAIGVLAEIMTEAKLHGLVA